MDALEVCWQLGLADKQAAKRRRRPPEAAANRMPGHLEDVKLEGPAGARDVGEAQLGPHLGGRQNSFAAVDGPDCDGAVARSEAGVA